MCFFEIMFKSIVKVKLLQDFCLHLWFEDGINGVVDISKQVAFTGIFEPLKEPSYFERVEVDDELGTIRWPNGADLDPEGLYALVSEEPLPDFEAEILAVAEEKARYE